MKRITRFKKRTWILLGVVAAIAAMASVGAYAYWTQSGSGTGSASTGTTTAISVVQDSAPSAMYPGSSAQALSGHFVNGNAGSVHITSVTAVVDPSWSAQADLGKPACDASDFTIAGSSGPYDVAPGSASTWSGLTIAMNDDEPSSVPANNQDNCKSVSVPILYTANP
jgi:hypothetical protein